MLVLLKKNEFSKNIVTMFSGVFISQVVIIFSSLILARLYSPEQFGDFSLFVSIVSLLSILATARYENAIIIIKKNHLVIHMIKFLHLLSVLFFIFILLVLFLLNENILTYLKINNYYALIPVTVLIYAFFQISTNINIREKKFSTIAISKIIMASVAIISQLYFYYLEINLGLIYGYTSAYLVTLFFLYGKKYQPFDLSIDQSKTLVLLKKYFYFVKHALPADFLNNLSINIVPMLIAVWFDMTTLGLYFLGYKIVNLPLQLISATVGKVYFQKISIMYHANKKELYTFTKKVVVILFFVITIPLIVLYIWGEEIIVITLGEKWSKAGTYMSLLSIMFFFRTLFSPISSIAEVVQKVHVILYFSVYILSLTILSLYIGYIFNSFTLAITLLSISGSFGYLFLLLYFMSFLKKIKNEN